MAQTVSIVLNSEERKRLEAIAADRSRPLKHDAARPIDSVVAPSHGLLDGFQWRVRAFAGKGAL